MKKKNIKFVTISNHVMGGQWLPAAAGNIIASMAEDIQINMMYCFLPIEFQNNCLSKEEFIHDLKITDILCLTNYVWNQTLNDTISLEFKKINPYGIVVYGGPNVPKFPLDIIEYVEERKYVNYFFTGPGEKTFKKFLLENKISNTDGSYCHSTYKLFNHSEVNYSQIQITSEEFPEPIKLGLYDHILNDTKFQTIGLPIETTRGCPYSCSFCDWGGQSNSKIIKFDQDKLLSEIYLAMKNDSVKYIDFCDANYGIFARDVEIIKHICLNKNKVESVSFSGVAKNGSKYIDEIYTLVKNNFSLVLNETKISLQTLSPTTLEINKRSNISVDKLLKQLNSPNTPIRSAELIIGLPGETGESWAETIFNTAGIGFTSLKIHRLILSPNILLNDPEFQKKHQIRTLNVKIPRLYLNTNHIGHLENEGYDTETLIVENDLFENFRTIAECSSYDVDEMVKMHKVTLWYKLFIETKFLLPIFKEKISPDLLRINYQLFEKKLNNLPFLSFLFENALTSVNYIFSKSSLNLTSLKNTNYFLYVISSEKYHIVKNMDIVINELQQIYQNHNFLYLKDIQKKLLDINSLNEKNWKIYKLKSPYALRY